ncbi:hypothetical protein, partial [Roseibium sp. LAB1]
ACAVVAAAAAAAPSIKLLSFISDLQKSIFIGTEPDPQGPGGLHPRDFVQKQFSRKSPNHFYWRLLAVAALKNQTRRVAASPIWRLEALSGRCVFFLQHPVLQTVFHSPREPSNNRSRKTAEKSLFREGNPAVYTAKKKQTKTEFTSAQ